jgi:CBS domain-containing protein
MNTLPKQVNREFPSDFATLCASDVMQTSLITVRASDPLSEVERVLADAHISGVPVLDDNDSIIGVLSMSDLVNSYAEDDDLPVGADYRDLEEDADPTEVVAYRRTAGPDLCAGDLMTTEISCVAPSASLREVARTMVGQQVHRVLVVERSRVMGLVTTLDVLRALAD